MDRYRKSIEQLDNHLKQIHEKHVIVLGNDDSGKRTLMKKLCKDQRPIESIVPIVGFDLRVAQNEDKLFTSWKVGGCSRLEPIWKKCFEYPPEVLIFVVNSADRDSIDDTLIEFKLFEKYLTKNVVVAIAANKQDIENAMTAEFIRDKFRTECKHVLVQCKNWRVFPTCFKTGIGLSKIIDWIETESKRAEDFSASNGHLEFLLMEKDPLEKLDLKSRPSEMDLSRKLQHSCDIPENDDEFINMFNQGQVLAFDHRAHLRIPFIYVNRLRDKPYSDCCFLVVNAYLNFFKSAIVELRFNRTMTLIWVHFVVLHGGHNYSSFQEFLQQKIEIMWGGLWRNYYTKEVLFGEEARRTFVRPDLKDLDIFTWNGQTIDTDYYMDK